MCSQERVGSTPARATIRLASLAYGVPPIYSHNLAKRVECPELVEWAFLKLIDAKHL